MRLLLFLAFSMVVLNAFEVEMIDETAEAKKNTKAKDGKTIYKPIDKNIIEPMKKNVVEPMAKNIIKPIKKSIIYPIGSAQAVTDNSSKKESNSSSNDNINSPFATKEELNNTIKKEEVEVDNFFDGLKEGNSTKKIAPVDIE